MTTTTTNAQPSGSMGLKLFAGAVAGLSAALITSSLLYLLWFIPLGRPGSHVPTVDEIIPTIRVDKDTRSAEELRQAAEGVRSRQSAMANFYSVVEILILTSTCLVAAYFASLYGRTHDAANGRAAGTLLQPTLIGTAVGAVVLWALFYVLIAKPGEAHPSTHGAAAAEAHAPPGPAHAVADHGSQPPSVPRTEAVQGEHAPEDWSAWLVENVHPAELVAYLLGTITAALVAVIAPRGAERQTTIVSTDHTYMPAH